MARSSAAPADVRAALAANLRKLCSYYASVSEVARELGINRQQFTKYLSGAAVPSLRNLRRITDFFGVDEFEILLPPAEFATGVLPRTGGPPREAAGPARFLPAPSAASQAFLARYCGFFHVYFRTPAWPRHLVRCLTHLYQEDGRTVSRSFQRLAPRRGRRPSGALQTFDGVVLQVVDRLCILERETMVEELVSMTVLYPSYRHALRLLTGVMSGIASGGSRQPFATRIAFEYLGRKADEKEAVAACGLYPEDHDGIAEEIRACVRNDIAPGEEVMLPRPY